METNYHGISLEHGCIYEAMCDRTTVDLTTFRLSKPESVFEEPVHNKAFFIAITSPGYTLDNFRFYDLLMDANLYKCRRYISHKGETHHYYPNHIGWDCRTCHRIRRTRHGPFCRECQLNFEEAAFLVAWAYATDRVFVIINNVLVFNLMAVLRERYRISVGKENTIAAT